MKKYLLGFSLSFMLLMAYQGVHATPAKQKKSGAITKAQAVKLVSNLPEVKKFIANVKAAGKARGVTSHIELDRKEEGDFIIHVFELVPDGEDSSHTATFNWYHVNAKTGKISKEF